MQEKERLEKIIKKENVKKYGFSNEKELNEYYLYLKKIDIGENEDFTLLFGCVFFCSIPLYCFLSILIPPIFTILFIIVLFGWFLLKKIKKNSDKKKIRKSEKFNRFCSYKQNNSLYQFIAYEDISKYYNEVTTISSDMDILPRIYFCLEEIKWILAFINHFSYYEEFPVDEDGNVIEQLFVKMEKVAEVSCNVKKRQILRLIKNYLSMACIEKVDEHLRFFEYIHSIKFIQSYCSVGLNDVIINKNDIYDLAYSFVVKYKNKYKIGDTKTINRYLMDLKKTLDEQEKKQKNMMKI